MALTDIILLAIVVIAAVTGAMRGIVAQIGAIAALLAAILVCRFFGGTVADALVSHGSEHEATLRVLCYALVLSLHISEYGCLPDFSARRCRPCT